ncbi:hypothetical protein C1H70_16965 [Halomonas urumqiensis]|uniref:Lysylphosphatidylglycerol synthetase family protein n=1 Tax=Halomonas urumqiensis TaxID=1684789 RepID=A0A2N7UDD9_9GAMM|nr:hypothetical protein C1H70_16965 [Halomonas urumqiensis]PTB03582.1 UPF0104 family protein [Halomonas urumqiensis]
MSARWQRISRYSRPLMGALLLGALWWWFEPSRILAEVRRLSSGWAGLALLLTLPPLVLSAWRWRLTARLLGLGLGWRDALREYYLALFLNQMLPGGVAGDAARAWRHSRASGQRGSAWRAVIIERVSGQLAMAVLTVAVLVASPLWHGLLGDLLEAMTAGHILVSSLCMVTAGLLVGWVWRHPPAALRGFGADLKRSLLATSVWPKQLGGSLVVVISYALVFTCAARSIGVELGVGTLLALTPPVLLAMLIPLSVAGWGVREGAAALIWGLAGLPPAQGVAVSMAYGVLVLLASLPGGLLLLNRALHPARRGSGSGSGGGAPAVQVEQVQVEQGVVTAGEGARQRSTRVVESRNGRQAQPRASGTDQQRRHQQVQAIENVGVQKARHGDAAAFDQHSGEAALGQHREYRSRVESPMGNGQGDALHMGGGLADRRHAFPVQVQCRGRVVPQQGDVGRHTATRVENHPHRIGPRDMTHGQLGVVFTCGTGTYHHGIDQCAQAVQVDPALEPIDVVGVTALGGDSPIQALPELGHRQWPAMGRNVRQAIQQHSGVITHRSPGMPAGAGKRKTVHAGRVSMGDGNQCLPGQGLGQQRFGGGHVGSVSGVRCHHAM